MVPALLRLSLKLRAQSDRQYIGGLPKTLGLVIDPETKGIFSIRVREQPIGNDLMTAIVEPVLVVRQPMREQIATLDRSIRSRRR